PVHARPSGRIVATRPAIDFGRAELASVARWWVRFAPTPSPCHLVTPSSLAVSADGRRASFFFVGQPRPADPAAAAGRGLPYRRKPPEKPCPPAWRTDVTIVRSCAIRRIASCARGSSRRGDS